MNGRVEILAFFLPKGDWIEKNELLKTGDKTQSADGIVRIDLSPGNSQEDPRIYQSKYQNSPGLPDIMAQLPGIPEHLPDKPEHLEVLGIHTSQSAQHPNAD